MQLSVQKVAIDVISEQSEGSNPNAIFDQQHQEPGDHKDSLFPKRAKREVSYEQCQDEKRDAGADPAAFLSNFDAHLRQMKDKSLSQNRCPAEIKQHFGDRGGS